MTIKVKFIKVFIASSYDRQIYLRKYCKHDKYHQIFWRAKNLFEKIVFAKQNKNDAFKIEYMKYDLKC